MIGHLDDVQVVLDDEHRVARVRQTIENIDQARDVRHVQTGRRLVEHIDRPAGAALRKLRRKLDALRLAAGERCGRLTELDIAEADIHERLQPVADLRLVLKKCERLFDGHVQHLGNILALIVHLERLAVIALALADLARDVNIRQEVHLDLQQAVAGAGLAAAAANVEREAPGAVAAQLRVLRGGEKAADIVKQAGIRRRIGARRAADGTLVDIDDLVQILHTVNAVAFPGTELRMVEPARKRFIQYLVDE